MTKLILTALVVIGGGVFWVWKRYFSIPAKIRRKEERIAEIMEQEQDALENLDQIRFNALDLERLRLCEQIHRLRG